MNSADKCRENGWTVGDVLEGDEGYGPTRIMIMAIGIDSVLARPVSHNGKPERGREGQWCLDYRDWKRVNR